MSSLVLARLTNRKILKIVGPDCYPYLQGLISNDLRFLYEPDRIHQRKHARPTPNAISTFMLNPLGRAICDLLIYRTPLTKYSCEFSSPGVATDHDELLIECDSRLASGLGNTLYGYRVRRKIQVAIADEYSVWCLYPHIDHNVQEKSMVATSQISSAALLGINQEVVGDIMTIVNDPRNMMLGMRIITRSDDFSHLKSTLNRLIDMEIKEAKFKDYIYHRYTFGIGEGLDDHPESNCLPLECNADYLGSVSFNKGCYLGQELTSRIHNTGVVRKRIMPIILDLNTTSEASGLPCPVPGCDIIDSESKKKLGILRHVERDRALALLRFEQALSSSNLEIGLTHTKIRTYKPEWWL